jgi:hypothetical protein
VVLLTRLSCHRVIAVIALGANNKESVLVAGAVEVVAAGMEVHRSSWQVQLEGCRVLECLARSIGGALFLPFLLGSLHAQKDL